MKHSGSRCFTKLQLISALFFMKHSGSRCFTKLLLISELFYETLWEHVFHQTPTYIRAFFMKQATVQLQNISYFIKTCYKTVSMNLPGGPEDG